MFAVISKGKERISLGNRFLRSRCKTGEGDFEQSERKLRFPISQSGWLGLSQRSIKFRASPVLWSYFCGYLIQVLLPLRLTQ